MAQPHSTAAQVLGERVRNRREELGLSQEDMADLAGMHWTNWGKIERGQANPNLLAIIRISSALNLDPAKLVQGIRAEQLPDPGHQLTAADLIRARNAGR